MPFDAELREYWQLWLENTMLQWKREHPSGSFTEFVVVSAFPSAADRYVTHAHVFRKYVPRTS